MRTMTGLVVIVDIAWLLLLLLLLMQYTSVVGCSIVLFLGIHTYRNMVRIIVQSCWMERDIHFVLIFIIVVIIRGICMQQ